MNGRDDWLNDIDPGDLVEPEEMDPGFAELLAKIKADSVSAYGELSWNGEERTLETTFQLQQSVLDTPAQLQARSVAFLEQFTPDQQRHSSVKIVYRDGKPVRLRIEAGTGTLPAETLAEYAKRAGIK